MKSAAVRFWGRFQRRSARTPGHGPPEVPGTDLGRAAGEYTIEDPIARVRTANRRTELTMLQRWPVRKPRPYRSRQGTVRTSDHRSARLGHLLPARQGRNRRHPGRFGSGKTVTQHSIAKWADAAGHRLHRLRRARQRDDRSAAGIPSPGRSPQRPPLMERTVLIANTSNMPVAAREASIYTGITIAEYYRDMGYHVALMADSTSRWAEALREISGRLEEMPAEEGYPAYLADRLAEFYERAGAVETLSGQVGSVSVIGAVSPPGGDFSEPVTQHTKRFIRCFWALDKALASARHYPSINWLDSYSEYMGDVAAWWLKQVGKDWYALRTQAMELLSEESRLSQIVKLVGPDTLPDEQRLVLETARLLREGFLQQSSFDDVDMYSTVQKQIRMLNLILHFHQRAQEVIKLGVPIAPIHELPIVDTLIR